MRCLRISNDCEVEPNAFKLLGACTKRDDGTKIGFFGSGLKYAMATFMRQGIGLRIFAGLKEVKLGILIDKFREQEFEVITVDGERTSLTTSMGPTWKIWHAIREIYCNALDEEGCELKVGDCESVGVEGKTIFHIEIDDEIEKIVLEWDKYFTTNREPVANCGLGTMYTSYSSTVNIYRKTIRCYDADLKSLWDYDIPDIDINESRVLMYNWCMLQSIARIFCRVATIPMLQRFVGMIKGEKPREYIETRMDWDTWDIEFNNQWIEFLEGRMLVPQEYAGSYEIFLRDPMSVMLPHNLIRKLKDQFKDRIVCCTSDRASLHNYAPVVADKKMSYLLEECLKFFNEVKLPIKHKIEIGIFASSDILGSISEDKTTIILSTKVFDLGKKRIACTILEEWAHIESEKGDETRGFQDFLIGQIITNLENTNGVFL